MTGWSNGPGYREAVDVSAEDYEPEEPFGAVWVGTAGNLNIVDARGVATVHPSVAAGMWHPFPASTKILNASTTAAGIVVGRPLQ